VEDAVTLTATEAVALRMASLLLTGARRPTGVAGVVEWFGAMQAQDLNSIMWSLGVRLPELTAADIHQALERREALRTWPMRGTIHLVPPRDARWMVELLGAKPLAGAAKRREHLGLSARTADASVDALAEALAGGARLTRSQCLEVLDRKGLSGEGQRGYHVLWYASQRGVTCIGPNIGSEQTFVLLDDWAPDQVAPERDEALGIVATRFFRARGPASRADLQRWAGITAAEVKTGIAAAGDALRAVTVGGTEMYADPSLVDDHPKLARTAMHLLPGFDEYLLGYKNRSLLLDPEHATAIVPGNNGVFQATLTRGGRVVGTWKRSTGLAKTTVDLYPLVDLSAADRKRAETALTPYRHFLDRPVTARWH
jgi:Winged helix DNA-binding domain